MMALHVRCGDVIKFLTGIILQISHCEHSPNSYDLITHINSSPRAVKYPPGQVIHTTWGHLMAVIEVTI